jgi:heme/copper-type cytochrome/quinol oxidase subunit 2
MNRNVYLVLLSFLFLASGCQKKPPADEHISVTLKKYSIEPSLIRVKSGEIVELEITAVDVQHGLDIPDLGIKTPVQPGRPTTVTFKAPAKGEYRMACGVICGPHHEDMVGKLVVE